MGRILQARYLYEDAIIALPLDQRLDGAELVDALLDDLDRLLDGLAEAIVHRGLRDGQSDQAVAGVGHIEIALRGAAEQPAERLRQVAKFRQRIGQIGIVSDANLDRIALHGKVVIQDPGGSQRALHVLADLAEPAPLHVLGIDLEQQVRAALQVEAEHHSPLCPKWPTLHRRFREEVRHRAKTHDQRSQDNAERRLPPGEVLHRVVSSG